MSAWAFEQPSSKSPITIRIRHAPICLWLCPTIFVRLIRLIANISALVFRSRQFDFVERRPMNWISTFLTIVATTFIVLPTSSAPAETEAEMIARGRYIATAIQGCGCHTREKTDGSKDENWH